MSQDTVADALNQIMNAKKARKTNVIINKYSKLLKHILDFAKENGLLDYEIQNTKLIVEIKDLNYIMAIKPRYTVPVKKIDYYVRRYLPAKNFGFIIVSTNQGLMDHKKAEKESLGGCLVAYMY
ncbi:MAG: 30S ribosomal protein S8 [Nanoarchaeota archaeon]